MGRFNLAAKRRLILLLSGLLSALLFGLLCGAELEQPTYTLELRNGDHLRGQLNAFNPPESLQWRHPGITEAMPFDPSVIEQIFIPPYSQPAERGNCKIVLTNMDELNGTLVSATPTAFVLDTWYAGHLTVVREHISKIHVYPKLPPALYQGPNGLKGWTLGDVSVPGTKAEPWVFHSGAFYARHAASIARDLKLPDRASIQMDLAWKGSLHLAIAIYTDYLHPINLGRKQEEPEFGGFYSLQLSNLSINLMPITQTEPLKYLGGASVKALREKNHARLEVRADKARKTIALLVDGEMIRIWRESGNFVGEGSGMRFVHQGRGKIRVSNLVIRDWDGQYPETIPAPKSVIGDLVQLQDGTALTGKFESIVEGNVHISKGGKTINVVLGNVKLIKPRPRDAKGIPPKSGNLRAEFNQGGQLTFELQEWGEAGMKIRHLAFGEALFNPLVFSRVIFNLSPVDPPKTKQRAQFIQ